MIESRSGETHWRATSPLLWPTLTPQEWLRASNRSSSSPLSAIPIDETPTIVNTQQPIVSILGDTRAAVDGVGPSALWYALASSVMSSKPRVFLHLGDWVKRGRSHREWSAVISSLRHLDQLPLLTTRGNHDRGGIYEELGLHPRPGQPLYLAEVGPLLFIMLDSEVETSEARFATQSLLKLKRASQQRWRDTLRRRGIKFLIWAQHRPLWSGGNHGNDERGWREWLLPALEELEVSLFLAGHDHHYERFCESLGQLGSRRCVSERERGVVYITSGGGASVTIPLADLAWRASRAEVKENQALRQFVSGSPHYLELSCSPQRRTPSRGGPSNRARLSAELNSKRACDSLRVHVWAVPYEGRRALIDDFELSARSL